MKCGACDVLVTAAQRVIHPVFPDGSILCGATGKRTFLYAQNETRPELGTEREEQDDDGTDET